MLHWKDVGNVTMCVEAPLSIEVDQFPISGPNAFMAARGRPAPPTSSREARPVMEKLRFAGTMQTRTIAFRELDHALVALFILDIEDLVFVPDNWWLAHLDAVPAVPTVALWQRWGGGREMDQRLLDAERDFVARLAAARQG